MEIVKLDGFSADGFGHIIGTAADLVDGDVMRIDGRLEQRFYAQPPPTPYVPQPIPLTQIGFITLCQEAGGMSDAQLVACKADALFAAMWIKFTAAQTLDKSDTRVAAGLQGLEGAGYLPNGATATLAAWPTA